MRRRFLKSAPLLAMFSALFSPLLLSGVSRAGILQILPIAGYAYGVDGNNVVGTTSISHLGFLYDGKSYTAIQPPGSSDAIAFGISGSKIVGSYHAAKLDHGFVFLSAAWKRTDFA